jgi:hypothetical protein
MEILWKEAVMGYFKAFALYLPAGNDNHRTIQVYIK